MFAEISTFKSGLQSVNHLARGPIRLPGMPPLLTCGVHVSHGEMRLP